MFLGMAAGRMSRSGMGLIARPARVHNGIGKALAISISAQRSLSTSSVDTNLRSALLSIVRIGRSHAGAAMAINASST